MGTLEQLNVTPLASWQLIVGKVLPYAAIALFHAMLVTVVAVFWFQRSARAASRCSSCRSTEVEQAVGVSRA